MKMNGSAGIMYSAKNKLKTVCVKPAMFAVDGINFKMKRIPKWEKHGNGFVTPHTTGSTRLKKISYSSDVNRVVL